MLRLATVALLLAVVAACGGRDDEAGASVPTTTAPATTAAPSDEDQLRQLAVEWGETVEGVSRGEADAEQARELIEGDYLDGFLQRDADDQAEGLIARPMIGLATTSSPLRSTAMKGPCVECVVDADVLVVGESGEVVNDEVNARRYQLSAQWHSDGWRFTAIERSANGRTAPHANKHEEGPDGGTRSGGPRSWHISTRRCGR